MCFVMSLCENHFSRMKNDEMLFSLFEIIKHKCEIVYRRVIDVVTSTH